MKEFRTLPREFMVKGFIIRNFKEEELRA